ncbi:MAG: hypothetical protein P8L74_04070 [Gammaproteobacteria bacterium]|nr:hypothetical protein [Gammaproteobacteria bacterium]
MSLSQQKRNIFIPAYEKYRNVHNPIKALQLATTDLNKNYKKDEKYSVCINELIKDEKWEFDSSIHHFNEEDVAICEKKLASYDLMQDKIKRINNALSKKYPYLVIDDEDLVRILIRLGMYDKKEALRDQEIDRWVDAGPMGRFWMDNRKYLVLSLFVMFILLILFFIF